LRSWLAASSGLSCGKPILEKRLSGLDLTFRRYYGTEFVSAAMDLWAYTNSVILDFSRRGKPTDNAAIESFNGRFREECLNVHWFASIDDAQQKIDAFRWDYNEHHPHRSLKGLSPREFAQRMLQTAAGSLS
jgi:transposase InsO family protein